MRDTGIGIPLDKQSRLFKSFQQVDASTTRHYGGTGLGLAICKRLAELMGGKVWVESDTGRGATFHFTALARSAATNAPANWQNHQPQLAGRRLLVVEDNLTNQRLIGYRASQWGMNVVAAHTSEDAFRRLAQSGPFDAALVDLQLPDMDGLTLAQEMHKQPYARHLPIVLLTSVRLRGDEHRPAQVGIAEYGLQAHPSRSTFGIPLQSHERSGPARKETPSRFLSGRRPGPPNAAEIAPGR